MCATCLVRMMRPKGLPAGGGYQRVASTRVGKRARDIVHGDRAETAVPDVIAVETGNSENRAVVLSIIVRDDGLIQAVQTEVSGQHEVGRKRIGMSDRRHLDGGVAQTRIRAWRGPPRHSEDA